MATCKTNSSSPNWPINWIPIPLNGIDIVGIPVNDAGTVNTSLTYPFKKFSSFSDTNSSTFGADLVAVGAIIKSTPVDVSPSWSKIWDF